jgi:hypothetical protein
MPGSSEIKLAILVYSLHLAVGQSTWDEWSRTARIFIKYDNTYFYRNLIIY